MNDKPYAVTGVSVRQTGQPIDSEVLIALRQSGEDQNLRIPMRDALYLVNMLLAISRDLKLQQYVQLDEFRGA